MFRLMNEYLATMKIETRDDIYQTIDSYLKKQANVTRYAINIYFNRYIVDIHMKKYSVEAADQEFRTFANVLRYPYSEMTLRYNEGSRVKYRYATCKEDKTGFYLDLIYSE